ncbi:MAG: hypothetical protein M1813_000512 [Trichoglossum hirsutum]|nr:MAG: hypothetical protein M1813_000512 [Trichoglossum hirsutum]
MSPGENPNTRLHYCLIEAVVSPVGQPVEPDPTRLSVPIGEGRGDIRAAEASVLGSQTLEKLATGGSATSVYAQHVVSSCLATQENNPPPTLRKEERNFGRVDSPTTTTSSHTMAELVAFVAELAAFGVEAFGVGAAVACGALVSVPIAVTGWAYYKLLGDALGGGDDAPRNSYRRTGRG